MKLIFLKKDMKLIVSLNFAELISLNYALQNRLWQTFSRKHHYVREGTYQREGTKQKETFVNIVATNNVWCIY